MQPIIKEANCVCMWYPEGSEENWLAEVIKQCIPTRSESDHALDIFNDKNMHVFTYVDINVS